ncbi:MAG TPA: zinc-binding dehydrogenase [Candidatus Polarisedimenticolaceae bacterium]|nr:zinc-binding dehydrogenase [Candidatus Polarisedimenticolaceae bacterium]
MPRAAVVTRSGGPRVLALREGPRRACGADELRIEVAFCGVNFADLAARAGVYAPAPRPPFVPGFEVAGTVAEAGAGSGFSPGERVLAVTRFGGYTDELVVPAAQARRLPPGYSLEEGAGLPAAYLTAYHALTETARARPGESVLIHAAAGGVGTAAVQLCRALGLVAFGTASSPEKLEFARSHGLAHGIDYAREEFVAAIRERTGGRGVDVVLDANGARSFTRSLDCLAPGGRLVVYGLAAALPPSGTLYDPRGWPRTALALLRTPRFHPFTLIRRNVSVCGVQLLLLWDERQRLAQELDALLASAARGAIRPPIDRIWPLGQVADAHRYMAARRTRGKILLAARA